MFTINLRVSEQLTPNTQTPESKLNWEILELQWDQLSFLSVCLTTLLNANGPLPHVTFLQLRESFALFWGQI